MSIHSSLTAATTKLPIPALPNFSAGHFEKLRLVSLSTAPTLAERDTLEPLSRRVSLDRKENLFRQDEPRHRSTTSPRGPL